MRKLLVACLAAALSVAGCNHGGGAPGTALVLPTPAEVGITVARRGYSATVHPRRVRFDPSADDRLLVVEASGDLQIWKLPAQWTLAPDRTPTTAEPSPKGAELRVTIPAEAVDACFVSGGAAIFVGDANGFVSLWRPDGQRLWSRQMNGGVVRAVECRHGRLVGGAEGGDIVVWRLDASVVHRRPLAHDGAVISLALSESGDLLVSEGADTLLRGWRLADGEPALVELGSYRAVNHRYRQMLPSLIRLDVEWGWDHAVVFLPSGDEVVSASLGGSLQRRRIDGEVMAERLDAHDGHHARALALAPNGNLLASGGLDAQLRLWSTTDLSVKTVIREHGRAVTGVAFDSSGRLASASLDGTVRLWDPSNGRLLGTLDHLGLRRRRPGARRRGSIESPTR